MTDQATPLALFIMRWWRPVIWTASTTLWFGTEHTFVAWWFLLVAVLNWLAAIFEWQKPSGCKRRQASKDGAALQTRWWRRVRCHGSVICCQYVDLGSCNSTRETHRMGRWAWDRRAKQAGARTVEEATQASAET